jgi:hypothetical protein
VLSRFLLSTFLEIGYVDWIGVDWMLLRRVVSCRGSSGWLGLRGGHLVSSCGEFVPFLCLCLGSCYWVGTACVYAPQPRLVKGCLASTLSVAVAVALVIAVAMPLRLTLTLTPTQAASHRININHHQLGS